MVWGLFSWHTLCSLTAGNYCLEVTAYLSTVLSMCTPSRTQFTHLLMSASSIIMHHLTMQSKLNCYNTQHFIYMHKSYLWKNSHWVPQWDTTHSWFVFHALTNGMLCNMLERMMVCSLFTYSHSLANSHLWHSNLSLLNGEGLALASSETHEMPSYSCLCICLLMTLNIFPGQFLFSYHWTLANVTISVMAKDHHNHHHQYHNCSFWLHHHL